MIWWQIKRWQRGRDDGLDKITTTDCRFVRNIPSGADLNAISSPAFAVFPSPIALTLSVAGLAVFARGAAEGRARCLLPRFCAAGLSRWAYATFCKSNTQSCAAIRYPAICAFSLKTSVPNCGNIFSRTTRTAPLQPRQARRRLSAREDEHRQASLRHAEQCLRGGFRVAASFHDGASAARRGFPRANWRGGLRRALLTVPS